MAVSPGHLAGPERPSRLDHQGKPVFIGRVNRFSKGSTRRATSTKFRAA
jgi:hypothetical protein